MRLSCPECAAEYDVPDTALDAARRLRCSACGTSWEWSPPAAAPRAEAAPEPPPQPPPQPKSQPQPPPQAPLREPAPAATIVAPEEAPRIEIAPERRMAPAAPPPPPEPQRRAMLAWAASLTIILVALAALYVWRGPVMRAWPPATRLYAALGLA